MKNTIAIVAIAGFAAAATAGSTFSLSISGPTVVAAGDTFTVEVSGDSSFGTHMLGGGFSLTSNSALVDNMSWTPASWSAFNEDAGYAGNGNHAGVVFGQLLLPIPGFDMPAAGSELGGVIGSFDITVGADGGVIDFQLVGAAPFTLEAVDADNGLATADSSAGGLSLGGLSVTVTPAPSAMALLGLGGLVAGRRRR
tara:strand:+ start:79786 stop:80376 length:591 start_codon:yes stop_codon:yes gene_type:complete